MTVAELIEVLNQYPEDLLVEIRNESGYIPMTEELVYKDSTAVIIDAD